LILVRFLSVTITAAVLSLAVGRAADTADYTFFKTRVEPVFLKKRAGHARCVVCHGQGGAPGGFGLQPLAHGSTNWTEEQSRQNYEIALRLIAPGDPTSSTLLMHPLAPSAGGDTMHSGGRQFASQDDPDWRVLADWVRQVKTPAYSNLKVLEPAEVGRTMRSIDVGLGVDCGFCHGREFASDSNPMKEVARRMITMTKQINTAAGVTCFTCHRAQLLPKMVPDPLAANH
jgi:cytochrome c553